MVKFVVLVKLREGVDPDKLWKFWEELYAPPHMVPGLIKYCINRVTKVVSGEATYWGMAEQWFDSEEALQNMLNSPKLHQAIEDFKRLPEGGFSDRVTDPMVVIMEEKIIAEGGVLLKK